MAGYRPAITDHELRIHEDSEYTGTTNQISVRQPLGIGEASIEPFHAYGLHPSWGAKLIPGQKID
jgi:hypothetical protein